MTRCATPGKSFMPFGLVTIMGLLGWLGAAPLQAALVTNRSVIVISIDGLRPLYYLPGPASAACPTLVALRNQGSYAEKALSVYPALTYPAHASIVTGVTPSRHGIIGNSMFAPPTEKEGRGFWYASDLQTPALWDVVHRAGGSVGAVSWPCSAGSEAIAWNLPEFWSSLYGDELSMTRSYSQPQLVNLIEGAAAPLTLATLLDSARRDEFIAASAAEIIRDKRPSLMFIHFSAADHAQHRFGPSSSQIPAVMSKLDGLIHDLLEVLQAIGIYDQTTIVVLGDHGFEDIKANIAPNVLLAHDGFITLQDGKPADWSAMALNSGGAAGVYINPRAPTGTATAVQALLLQHANTASGSPIYTLVEKDELTRRGGPTQAVFYLDAAPGHMFSGTWKGEHLVRKSTLKGNHGFNPETPEMATGFIICGNGVRPGVALDRISLIDIAPTVAALLGLEFPNVEGHVLQNVLASGAP